MPHCLILSSVCSALLCTITGCWTSISTDLGPRILFCRDVGCAILISLRRNFNGQIIGKSNYTDKWRQYWRRRRRLAVYQLYLYLHLNSFCLWCLCLCRIAEWSFSSFRIKKFLYLVIFTPCFPDRWQTSCHVLQYIAIYIKDQSSGSVPWVIIVFLFSFSVKWISPPIST